MARPLYAAVLLTDNIILTYNLGRYRYYPKETTENVNHWMLIGEAHSFPFEERCSGFFLVIAETLHGNVLL